MFYSNKCYHLKLMYITNDVKIAKIAEEAGVDRIFVDLEVLGKEKRQSGMNTVKSKHSISDISNIKGELKKSKVIVRINPINDNSKTEIDNVINNGADIVMLPYFKTNHEVKSFIDMVNGRTKTNLLVESKKAYENIDEILDISGIDEIHIGLNDLHLDMKKKFMFELLIDGTVETIAKSAKKHNIPFGIGGIAKLGAGSIPADLIIPEHYKLGSEMAILSRSFCNCEELMYNYKRIEEIFNLEVKKIRTFENDILIKDKSYFATSNRTLRESIERVICNV